MPTHRIEVIPEEIFMPDFLKKCLGALLLVSTSGYVCFIALF